MINFVVDMCFCTNYITPAQMLMDDVFWKYPSLQDHCKAFDWSMNTPLNAIILLCGISRFLNSIWVHRLFLMLLGRWDKTHFSGEREVLASMSPHTGTRTILNSLTECNSLNKTCKQLRHWHPSEYSLYHLSITMSPNPFDTMTVHGLYCILWSTMTKFCHLRWSLW